MRWPVLISIKQLIAFRLFRIRMNASHLYAYDSKKTVKMKSFTIDSLTNHYSRCKAAPSSSKKKSYCVFIEYRFHCKLKFVNFLTDILSAPETAPWVLIQTSIEIDLCCQIFFKQKFYPSDQTAYSVIVFLFILVLFFYFLLFIRLYLDSFYVIKKWVHMWKWICMGCPQILYGRSLEPKLFPTMDLTLCTMKNHLFSKR